MKLRLREILFRAWYWYVNRVDRNAEVLFMNYGFSEDGVVVPLDARNEADRYPIQLYHHLASQVEIKGKSVAEIGCGRGGGLSYIVKTFRPASAKGVDLDKRAMSFCNNHYTDEGLTFTQGDAQRLSLEDDAYDVVVNVESSHRYPDMSAFLGEVRRILRTDGYFLYTDFRYASEMAALKDELNSSGMTIVGERFITKEVVKALENDDARRRILVKKLTPRFLHKTALNFAGALGTDTYNRFASGNYVYFSYVLKKP